MPDVLWYISYYNNEKFQLSPAVFSVCSPFIYRSLQGQVQEIKTEETERAQYVLSVFLKRSVT